MSLLVKLLPILYVAICIASGYLCRKVKDLQDFATAKKLLATPIVILTFMATNFGIGSLVGDIEKIATDGIIFIISLSSFLIFCIYMHFYMYKFFDSRFANMISAGDMIEYFYGDYAGRVSALIGTFSCTLKVATQVTGVSYIVSYTAGYEYVHVVLAISVTVTIYSVIGGITSVAMSDAVQFAIIVFILPIIACLIISSHPPTDAIVLSLMEIPSHPKLSEYLLLFFISMFPFIWLHPPVLQRFLMTKSTEQISAMYKASFVVRLLVYSVVVAIAFSAMLQFPDVPPKLLFPAVVNSLPIVVGELAIVALLAAAMSTADSYLNTSAVLFTNNFIKKVWKLKPERELPVARIICIVIMLGSTLIASHEINILDVMYLGFCIWGSLVVVPLLAGVLYLSAFSKRAAFWTSFYLTSATFFTLLLSGKLGNDVFHPLYMIIASLCGVIVSPIVSKVYKVIRR